MLALLTWTMSLIGLFAAVCYIELEIFVQLYDIH
jgi:hypothetical protein